MSILVILLNTLDGFIYNFDLHWLKNRKREFTPMSFENQWCNNHDNN